MPTRKRSKPIFPVCPLYGPKAIYSNDIQACGYICNDGNPFFFTIPAGTVTAFSLVAANDQANSMACNAAAANLICMGNLGQVGACVDAYYEQNVEIQSKNPPITISVVAGSLPPGLNFSTSSIRFTVFGFPTTFGTFSFVVRVEDAKGLMNDKNFTIYVIDIAQDSLPNGQVGIAYSQTLTANGPTLGAVSWSIVGSLPAGLTLVGNIISGIPTTAQTSPFTVTMTDAR
jgi:Putative Ig domain